MWSPTPVPTALPTAAPTAQPTAVPTAVPTALPTALPTSTPTAVPSPSPTTTPRPSPLPTAAPTPLPSYACDESDNKFLYKLVMTDTGGDGWGDVAYTITTDGATRFTGTLEDGYSGIRYFCIEDNVHTIVVNGSKTEHSEICFEFDDTSGDAFQGCAPIVDVFHTSQGEIYGAPSPAPSPMPSALPSPVPSTAPSLLPTTPLPSPLPTTPVPSPLPSAAPTSLPTVGPSPSPTPLPTTEPTLVPSPAPSPLPTLAPATADLVTVSASFSLSGLDASSVTDDDIASLKTGIASILSGVDTSDIDNVAVTDASTRRLLRPSPTKDARRLATSASVSFDVALSISESLTYDDDTGFIDEVTTSLASAEDDSSNLVTAIQSAASTTAFDAVPSTSAVSSTSLVVLTRPPSFAPTPEPTAGWEDKYGNKIREREIMHYVATFGTTFLVTVFAVFVYFTHPAKEKISACDCTVVVAAWYAHLSARACGASSMHPSYLPSTCTEVRASIQWP